jgi:regulatory protein
MDQANLESRIPGWVLSKMQHYCAYQERCIRDVKTKLKSFHLQEGMEEKIILALKDEKYLDEARYARIFASGKLRINKWGKNKIYAALQKKNVPEFFILQGLAEIDDSEYIRILRGVVSAKSQEVKESDFDKHTKKVAKFAISKGFEPSLVWDVLNYKD